MSDIKAKVISLIVKKLERDPSKVTESSRFSEDLGFDSLDTVEIVMELESEFGIEIPDKDAEKIVTVGDAIKYIESQMKNAE
jgi:acyl carrier protein